MRTQHPYLMQKPKERLFSWIKHHTCSRDSWWKILLLVIFFYFINLTIDIKWLNVLVFNSSTLGTLIDQRTTNTATIISMTLAVIGFLIASIAVKEPYTYQLLFKRSKLYFAIYFTLSTIASLILISTLRDSSDLVGDYYSKLVLAGTYLVIGVLFVIGYLFRTIIYFTNPKQIWRMLHDELIGDVKNSIIESLIEQYSKSIYEERLKRDGAIVYNLSEAFKNLQLSQLFRNVGNEIKIEENYYTVLDVNLSGLSAFISPRINQSRTIYFSELSLNTLNSGSYKFVWIKNETFTMTEINELNQNYVVKRSKTKNDKSEYLRKHFDEKIEEYVKQNNSKDLKDILNSLVELYKMKMKIEKDASN